MTTRTETIVYGDFTAPAGTVVAAVVLTITDSTGAVSAIQSLSPGAQPVAVDLKPESYTASAQAVDATGAAIGPAATDSFVIAAPTTVVVSIPTSLTGV